MVTLCIEYLPSLSECLSRYGLQIQQVANGQTIDGSFWGDSEAGLVGNQLIIRADTPLHSALHEACHYICMDNNRRLGLHTDAGGDYDEENAVCYQQILLSDYIKGYSGNQMMKDMDQWGYSFRLGSAARWFNEDAQDALQWLQQHKLVDQLGQPTWQTREK